MKVTEDACLFGAFAAREIQLCGTFPTDVLDVGSGTGLLALMIAQECPQATITGVEIDGQAAIQALENVQNNGFSGRITVHHADFRTWTPENSGTFDVIVSNPPFFSNSIKSTGNARRTAFHDDQLTPGDLWHGFKTLLSEEGLILMVIPEIRTEETRIEAEKHGFFIWKTVRVRPNASKPVHRVFITASRKELGALQSEFEFCIRDTNGGNSETAQWLLHPFYEQIPPVKTSKNIADVFPRSSTVSRSENASF